jgi:hypothetical protein
LLGAENMNDTKHFNYEGNVNMVDVKTESMNDTKHFNYEGNVNMADVKTDTDLPKVQYKIKDVEFLTPARVTLEVNGKETSVMVSVDIINRKVYHANGQQFLSDQIFEYLDGVNNLPDDFFEAPDEIYEQVEKVDAESFKTTSDFVGE